MLTIYPRLEPLPADFARQVPEPKLLVQLDDDAIFVVAEEAGECRG